MNWQNRLDLLVALGDELIDLESSMSPYIQKASFENPWFTPANSEYQLHAIREDFLARDKLSSWVQSYDVESISPADVGIIMAGNIPLVGFHDFLCSFICGHITKIKLSDKDSVLFEGIMRILRGLDAGIDCYVEVQDRLEGYDAVIATGSDNTNRYFHYYFKDYPSLFRGSRNSFGVVYENTTDEDLKALMDDVFIYFGLGCRSVTKLYLPKYFDLDRLFEASLPYRGIENHPKYKNNLRYNTATYLMNQDSFLTNDIFILKQDDSLYSRIGVLHYEYYDEISTINDMIKSNRDQIQCLVSSPENELLMPQIPYGKSQRPSLSDYADDVDTMKFLTEMKGWRKK